jgi:hypothetical protein
MNTKIYTNQKILDGLYSELTNYVIQTGEEYFKIKELINKELLKIPHGVLIYEVMSFVERYNKYKNI